MVVDSKNLPSDDIMHRVRLIIEFVPLNQEDLITLLWQVRRTCGRTKTDIKGSLARVFIQVTRNFPKRGRSLDDGWVVFVIDSTFQ